jgi:large repetitive protein
MFRLRALALPLALALTATCSSSSTPPPDPGPGKVQPNGDMVAVSLGVTIDSRDDRGKPRLVRAVVPRAVGVAGMAPNEAARDHLSALTPLYLKNAPAADRTMHSEQRLRNGAAIVRLQQKINDIDIHQGELRVMVHPDGSLAAVSGTMRASTARTTFKSTPVAAVDRALDALYGKTRARPALAEGGDKAGFREVTVAATPEFSVESAHAKRELFAQGDQLIPIWTVELFSSKTGFDDAIESSARRYLISDVDGSVIRDVNLTHNDAFLYRVLADTNGTRIPLDGPFQSFNPHPTGTPDKTTPGLGAYNLVAIESFNAPRDPWLPNNATTTSGNNVEAIADINPPLGFSTGDVRPDVRAGRTLNHRYDFTAEPLANETQSKAAAVNVFFVTNWLHDFWYDSGFTEATGNAQLDNFGRGGIPGDLMLARAQANANAGSRNNASMSTPSDGLRPIMNMFLWTGKATTSLTTATATPATREFVTGPRNFELTAEVALAQDSVGGGSKACVPVGNNVAGKIGLFDFDGTCGSITAVNNLRAAGAIGVIGIIAIPGEVAQPLNGSAAANIPGVTVGFEDGQVLKGQLPTTVTLFRSTTVEHDGDFDNAIVAHEWGHYMHLRLASCEVSNQCFAMSEGWADFVALHMMLRATDDREGTFGVGLYALSTGDLVAAGFDDPGYFGIRRFPYSLNRTKNALSFRHIGDDNELPNVPTQPGPTAAPNSEVHNAGEVWAQMMWEAYNVLIDEHPRAEAQRRMADIIVAGMLLTPTDATMTEQRDALLAGAGALDTEDMLLMAAAFAGRGAGTCAIGPGSNSVDFTGVIESGTIAAKMGTSNVTVSDDGLSCDRDGFLDPGETGTIRLRIANSGILDAEGVTVTATSTTQGVTVGNRINVGTLTALSQADLTIPIRLAANAPLNSTLNLTVRVESDAGCDTDLLTITLNDRIGVDEADAVAKTDDLETKILAWTPAGLFGGEVWSRALSEGNNHVLFGLNAPITTDTQLVSRPLQASMTEPLVVTLKHAFDLEAVPQLDLFFDGGTIEVSNDNGLTFRDVTEVGVDPNYNAVISVDFDNPLAGRDAYSGLNDAFPNRETVTLNFGNQFAGQTVLLRFRLGTDFCCTGQGWEIDDIAVAGINNTPFPGFVPEPQQCRNGVPSGAAPESTVVRVQSMPRASLQGVPGINADP